MARIFDRTLSQYLEYEIAPITSTPLTMAAWGWSSNTANAKVLMSLANNAETDRFYSLFINQQDITYRRVGSEGWRNLIGGTMAASARYHYCGVSWDDTNVDLYVNGVSSSHSLTATPSGWNRLTVGRLGSSTPGTAYWHDGISGVALWGAALGAGEARALADGVPPSLVRPNALVGYWPLVNDDRDAWIYGYHLTAYNSPTFGPKPQIPAAKEMNYRNRAGFKMPTRTWIR